MDKRSSPPSTNDQTIMFGSIVSDVFSSIHSSLHDISRDRIFSTLPDIENNQQESCKTKLYSKICKAYVLHMDAAQLYAESEIFVMDKSFSRKKRERVLNKFIELEQGQGQSPAEESSADGRPQKNDAEDVHGTGVTLKYKMPASSQEIPSANQMKAIDEDILSLRKQLRDTKEQTYALRQELSSLNRDENSAKQANETLTKLTGEKRAAGILESVSNVKEDKEDLKVLNSQAKELMEGMKEMERAKDNSNETQEFGDVMKAAAMKASHDLARPKKKKTLEEDYADRLKENKVSANVLNLFQK